MAITRLKDIVTVFENKWTFGDAKFGYDGEVNDSHSTQYPLLLINGKKLAEIVNEIVFDQGYKNVREYLNKIDLFLQVLTTN